MRLYYRSLHQLDFDIAQQWNLMEHHQRDLDVRKFKVLKNLCIAQLQSGDLLKSKKVADVGLKALNKSRKGYGVDDADETEARLLYQRARANVGRGFHDDAVKDLRDASKLQPKDSKIRELLEECQKKAKADAKGMKEMWKEKLPTMFPKPPP